MNATKLQLIKKLLVGLAEYYQTELTAGQLAMYAEDLEDLDLDQLGSAIKLIRRDPQNRFFPRPAVIREAITGSLRDEAMEASNRIVEAISKYGYTNGIRARQFVGELGWRVVEREGGWENICRSISSYDELGIRKAQWRELCAATLRRGNIGADQNAPALAGPTHIIRNLLPDHMKKEGS